ncbi:MAG: AAA family ATPase [Polyangiaceae bacterium]|nr:AAA family ATPase [Polyangiaceae bacterium]
MAEAGTGVVVGKFYPPHRGHQLLVETGRAAVRQLYVFVCHHESQVIPGELRAAWLREMCGGQGGVEVRVIPDVLDGDDSPGWAAYIRRELGFAPELVFTSEDYGEPFAYHLGARHVLVDRARRRVPCSATAIRADPLGHLAFLAPCVRAYFVRRVVCVGAESTGKTTLTERLARHYGSAWVPEYGRELAEQKLRRGDDGWRSSEFERIAREQARREDAAARGAERVLLCDTDAFATGIWHERYLGRRSPAVEAVADGRRVDLYLLAAPDVPFVQDGTRDGEHLRHWMHRRFADALAARGARHVLLDGPHAGRFARAVAAIDALLGEVRL